jgi:hypothetical protein
VSSIFKGSTKWLIDAANLPEGTVIKCALVTNTCAADGYRAVEGEVVE